MKRAAVLLAMCAAVTAGAQTLPTCTTGLAPWKVDYAAGYTGLTQSEACTAAGSGFGANTGSGSTFGRLIQEGSKCELYYEGAGPSYWFSVVHVCVPEVVQAPDPNPASSAPAGSPWTSTPQMVQALLVGLMVVLFGMGYRAGDKL
jgi:hypothetical protein